MEVEPNRRDLNTLEPDELLEMYERGELDLNELTRDELSQHQLEQLDEARQAKRIELAEQEQMRMFGSWIEQAASKVLLRDDRKTVLLLPDGRLMVKRRGYEAIYAAGTFDDLLLGWGVDPASAQ
jgi:hypothetical protein